MGLFEDSRKALDVAAKTAGFSIPVVLENVDYSPDTDTPYLYATLLPVDVDSSRPSGEDYHTGIYQIDVNYPSNSATGDITRTADTVNAVFKSGERFEWGAACVRIDSVNISPIRRNGGWAVLTMTMNWSTFSERL